MVSEERCGEKVGWSRNYTIGKKSLEFDKVCFGFDGFYGIISHFSNKKEDSSDIY